MSELRRLIVDTDTGSDDVWAIIESLRATEVVRVEAITVVCGNLPLDLCVKNALLAQEAAGRAFPPVFRGMERPLMRRQAFYAKHVHGEDGLGNMNLPAPLRSAAGAHAIDAIISMVMENPGEIEIATCGPLTNLAMALLKEPRLAENVKKVWILGGSGGGFGNMTPAAEYNVYIDPEAASIVLNAGMDTVWVNWDASRGDTEITPEEVGRMEECGDPAARFCARCTSQLRAYQREAYGRDSFGVIDSILMTAALYPEIMRNTFRANCAVETAGRETRGYFRIDHHNWLGLEPNCTVCPAVDAKLYKQHLFRLLGVQ